MPIKNCVLCTKEFKARKTRNKFCSQECRYSAARKRTIGKCGVCSKEIICMPSDKKFNKGKYCSRDCWRKSDSCKNGRPPVRYGSENNKWNGGKSISRGYIHVRISEHPRRNKRGYVPEQVLVAEKFIGRFLSSEELVHHINSIKTDNSTDNLYIFPNRSEHTKYHMALFCSVQLLS